MNLRQALRQLRGYIRSGRAYLRTEKGSHDARDYGRALVLLFASIALAWMLARLFFGGQAK